MAMTPTSPLVKLEPKEVEVVWPVPVDDHRPYCWCLNPELSNLFQANTERNRGRWFYTCRNNRDNQCKFFMWADQVIGKAHPARPIPNTPDMNTHIIGFPNTRRLATNNVTPPRTPDRFPRNPSHTPGAWPAEDDEDEFFSTQGSPLVPPQQLNWPAGRMSTPDRALDQPMEGPHTPRTPARGLVDDPMTPVNISTRSKAPPPTPSYITPATSDQLNLLFSLPAEVQSAYANALGGLAEHLKRQDRLLKAADKTILFRERKIDELKAEIETYQQRLAELDSVQQDADMPDAQSLALKSAVHEAQIAELQAAVAALQGNRIAQLQMAASALQGNHRI
ncbi:hypothetical protein CALVIDRAFT_430676 [Calocera viscosa TUFC12733]|uniref:GRF-type domain-containing protein n=1 Tax=Calocera viscosa (strain TUFC12733) TaxID=1330018 RepID=A0A167PNG2_CALVF|nr:hypothetical protein CALVIDRAFT_430676 [Calocera viscosa TUFC12733]